MFEKDVLSLIGTLAVEDVRTAHVTAVTDAVLARGVTRMALSSSVEVYRQDLSVFRVAQLVSHNSQFDGPFLKAWFERMDIFLPASYRVFCTLQRAYWFFQENPQLPPPDDYRLGTLCEYFEVPLNPHEAHAALADVRAAVGLYRAMRNLPEPLPIEARRVEHHRSWNLG